MKMNASFVRITKETAPNLIKKLEGGEGSKVSYAVMKNGELALHSGQSIKSPESRNAVIDKIKNYVNELENKSMQNGGESFIAIA